MFTVLTPFIDLTTGKRYHKGEIFPCESVSPQRLEELATSQNRRNKPLIAEVKENTNKTKEEPKKANNKPRKAKKEV